MSVLLERDFSRKAFLKTGGALVVGFSVLGAAGEAAAAESPYASHGPFDQGRIDSWLVVNADNTVTLKPGKVELGQGTMTGLMMVAAEELDVGLASIRPVMNVDTNISANQGATVGSQGIQTGGKQIRAAAAAAKGALLDLASAQLGVPRASLSVNDGVVSGGGRSATYGQLVGHQLLNVRIPNVPFGATSMPNSAARSSGASGTKPIGQYKLVGKTGTARIDIPDKVTGRFVYTHNIKVPGMVHGRVVRPRGQGAYGRGTAPQVLAIDESSIRGTGAQVVRYKDFVGVVAPTEWQAIQAAATLKVTWGDMPRLPSSGNLFRSMREHDAAGRATQSVATNTGNFNRAFSAAPVKLSQTYKFPYNASAAMGPECCVATVTPQGARVFSNTQSVWGTRQNVYDVLAAAMGRNAPPLETIRVTYYEGGSTYGPAAPYDDAAQAAALMSALVQKPVRLQFMRWDSTAWGNYGPPMMADMRGAVDANGKLTGLELEAFVSQYYVTPPTMQAASGRAIMPEGVGALNTAMAGDAYTIPNHRVVRKTLPLEDNLFKMRHLRAPAAPQTAFATEQMIDELAHAARIDPIEFRRRNLAGTGDDPSQRWRNVLEGAARLASWQPRVAASSLSSANVVRGRGFGFGHFSNSPAAGIVDIEVNKQTGKIVVKNVWATIDPGFAVYPDGLKQNEEGAAIQGISKVLHEQVAFDTRRVTSVDWVTYPVLRFKDTPRITMQTLSRTDVPDPADGGARSTGAGEPAVVPMAPAIANAFFDATGVRIREAPLTPARVRNYLRAAGAGG
jgi:CO/xanthine dehydrogenase Mo-binding subunit